VKEKHLKMLSEYRKQRCRCHMLQKSAPETEKACLPTMDRLHGGRLYCKLVGGRWLDWW